ncbi:MAG: hypothetical protein RL122_902 [Pseudomonadota bacterium]|jgi:hypothetical protein
MVTTVVGKVAVSAVVAVRGVNEDLMDCYAKRLHNPFSSAVQVVASAQIRALSFNGIDWELQFQCQTPRGIQYARIGLWSARHGFRPYPLDPSIDRDALEIAYPPIVATLETTPVPLPQDDHYEFWLLDETDHYPLALLASCRLPTEMSQARIYPIWKAVSASQLELRNTPEEERRGAPPLSYRLEQNVKDRAGQNPQAKWFLRTPDGAGQWLNAANEVVDTLAAEHFPPLLLRETWRKPAEQDLCDRYLQRLAPRLLGLARLSLADRARVEQMASHYAQEVAAHFHLYPAIADPQRMTALRVEARLRDAVLVAAK